LIACKEKWHVTIKKKSSNTTCKQSTTWITMDSWLCYNWHQTFVQYVSYSTSVKKNRVYQHLLKNLKHLLNR
jgi:hypothetical protein